MKKIAILFVLVLVGLISVGAVNGFVIVTKNISIGGAALKKSEPTTKNIVGDSPTIHLCPLGRELDRADTSSKLPLDC